MRRTSLTPISPQWNRNASMYPLHQSFQFSSSRQAEYLPITGQRVAEEFVSKSERGDRNHRFDLALENIVNQGIRLRVISRRRHGIRFAFRHMSIARNRETREIVIESSVSHAAAAPPCFQA